MPKTLPFTRGPWRAHLNVPAAIIAGHIVKVDDDIQRPICSVPEPMGGSKGVVPRGAEMQIANAHLIAAAPELFDFVAAYLKRYGSCRKQHAASPDEGGCWHCTAKHLVDKALGRKPRRARAA